MGTYSGRCYCGELEFEVVGEPSNLVFCYCKSCQVMSGSDKYFGAWFKKSQFKFTRGQPVVYSRNGHSGKPVNAHFCGKCHSIMCAEVSAGRFCTVAVSAIHSENSFRPKMCIYVKDAADWAALPENVPVFDTLPENIIDYLPGID